MNFPLYNYRPLDADSIRVLDLCDDGTSHMRHVKLKKSIAVPTYAALSYTWGSNTETTPFNCDGQNLPVRENLLLALQHLKRHVQFPIWIDAMCINQSDEAEKMKQIQMMTDIYKKAKKVFIWLGEELSETQDVVEKLPIVTSILARLKTANKDDLESIVSQQFILGLRYLLTCPWWSRLWVLQEATLAQDAVFVCGTQMIPWKVLSAITKQIHRLQLQSVFRGNPRRPKFCDGFTELHNIECVRHSHSTTLAPNLLYTCRQRACMNPCDRVYGIIGMMDQYVQGSITWEPDEKVEDLYPPFAAMLLHLDPTAELLSMNETEHRNPNLPSWCPDLHQQSKIELLADHEGYHAGYDIQTTPKFDYNPEQPRIIRSWGIVADIVKSVYPGEWIDENANDQSKLSQFEITRANVSTLQEYLRIVRPFVPQDDLWKIFIGEILGKPDSKLQYLAGFARIHDRLLSRRWKVEAESYQSAFAEMQTWSREIHLEPSSDLQAYLKVARRVCYGRKLFVTESGRVGFGPKLMQTGDKICIFKCVSVPFVLRKHDLVSDGWRLIGEAYVHGLMHGEYFRLKQKNFNWIALA